MYLVSLVVMFNLKIPKMKIELITIRLEDIRIVAISQKGSVICYCNKLTEKEIVIFRRLYNKIAKIGQLDCCLLENPNSSDEKKLPILHALSCW